MKPIEGVQMSAAVEETLKLPPQLGDPPPRMRERVAELRLLRNSVRSGPDVRATRAQKGSAVAAGPAIRRRCSSSRGGPRTVRPARAGQRQRPRRPGSPRMDAKYLGIILYFREGSPL